MVSIVSGRSTSSSVRRALRRTAAPRREKQEQRPQGVAVELDRALPADIDGAEQALQLVMRVDVGRCRPRLSRFVIGCRVRRPGRVAAG